MPRFDYKCPDCKEQVTVTHDSGVAGYEGCPLCGSEAKLQKVFGSFSITKGATGGSKPGALVKSHIEEAKKELKKDKDKLTKKDFKV